MSVLNSDQLLAKIKERIGEDSSDEALSFIEDVTDTLINYENITKDSTDWKAKYEENDANWRNKYKERFFSGKKDDDDEIIDDDNDTQNYTFEKLFKEGK